jgi:hypothetical protein
VEEELLAGCKNKLGAAVDALQDSVRIFHGRLPQNRENTNRLLCVRTCRSRFPVVVRESTTRARAAQE